VQDVATGGIANYGKIEVKLVGESTFRPFDQQNIPNLRFDSDEFQPDVRIGGFEHFRLNNGLVGTIFREALAHRIHRALGYGGLRSSFAFVGSNVWGNDTWIPMVLMEVYKPNRFCEDNVDLIGGNCVNMWEFPGDAASGQLYGDICQQSQCDNTRLEELATIVGAAPQGNGFKAATADIIDWESFHEFQCLSWMLWTGDDHLHNSNNNMIIERDDGKLVWMPYSVDISAGQEWYQNTTLTGISTLAQRCQNDSACWADTYATCENLVAAFDALNPEEMVDDVAETLRSLNMMRNGDEERYQQIRQWYVDRQDNLPAELQLYAPCGAGETRCADQTCQADAAVCNEPEHQCGGELTYCERYNGCIYRFEICPEPCPDETPFTCAINGQCVADEVACADLCEFGSVYCPRYGFCVQPVDFIPNQCNLPMCNRGEYYCEGEQACIPENKVCCGEPGLEFCPGADDCYPPGECPVVLCDAPNVYCEAFQLCLPPEECPVPIE
jgi:hypothetical protein